MKSCPTLLFPVLLLAGCGATDDKDTLAAVPLADTPLIGSYILVDYLFEYGNDTRLDSTALKITGTLSIGGDSSYLEIIRNGAVSTPTSGRITQIKSTDGRDSGELELTLDGADSAAAGKSTFSFRTDTLVLVTDVSKERDASKKGFRETAYYLRQPIRD